MDLGYTYSSAAIVPDGTDLPAVEDPMRDYIQTARPGSRAPHMWLGDGRSTLDLFGRGMVLVCGSAGDGWVRAAQSIANAGPLVAHALDTGGRLESLYGIEPDGAVLVRPDGFVAWRARSAPGDQDRVLRDALDAALGR